MTPAFRLDPLRELDNWLKDLMLPERFNRAAGEIEMTLQEEKDLYVVRAAIPDVIKEDILVQVEGNVVSILAIKDEHQQSDGTAKGRCRGSLSRAITLDHEVDEKAADAHYAHGVLQLILPKKVHRA